MRYFIEDDWLVVGTPCRNMSLTKDEIDLIKVSWRPVLEDSRASGILLFKELFTKFPDYLKLFPKFKELDVNNLDKNKRLVSHASKVIDTVTAVVNLLGDEGKQEILNEALQATAISHIRRHIGLDKFKNLGIILIDFMCQVTHRYQGEMKQRHQRIERDSNTSLHNLKRNYNQECNDDKQMNGQSKLSINNNEECLTLNHNNNNDNEQLESSGNDEDHNSNGMNDLQYKMKQTSLDQDDDDDDDDVCNSKQQQQCIRKHNKLNHHVNDDKILMIDILDNKQDNSDSTLMCVGDITLPQYFKYNIDTNRLVAAWTKLYSAILDIVQSETDKYANGKLAKNDSKEEEDMSNASSQYNPSSSSSLDDDLIRPF